MPIYEFTCDECGHRFEVKSSIAERDAKAICPKCRSRDVRTVFGSFAVGGTRSRGDASSLLKRGFGGAAVGGAAP